MSKILLELGPEAWKHAEDVERVKQHFGISHDYFDCWIYAFLNNKHFDFDETIAKLIRRADMEVNELGTIEVCDWMRENMRSGIMQIVGYDLEDRLTMYVVTKRDFPQASEREMKRKIFDMWMTYATRLRANNHTCRLALLVNQKDAGVWANSDMTFQSNIGIRVAKYFPGLIDRVYICSMNRALSAVAKPLIKGLPSGVRDKAYIITEQEVQQGKLLEYFDPSVIPVDLGGLNDCDNQENWERFASTVETYFLVVQNAIRSGVSVKDFEMQQLLEEQKKEEETKHRSALLHRKQQLQSLRSSQQQRKHKRTELQHQQRQQIASHPRIASGDSTDDSCCSAVEIDAGEERSLLYVSCTSDMKTSGFGSVDFVPFVKEQGDEADEGDEMLMMRENSAGVDWLLMTLEDQEEVFRESFIEIQDSQRRVIGERFMHDLQVIEEMMNVEGGAARLVMRCPAPARVLTRGIIWTLSVLVSLYFLTGTMFLLAVGLSMMLQLFLALYLEGYFVYPLGLVALVLGYQLCLAATRGFELVTISFRGRLFHVLRFLGRMGIVVQITFFVLMIFAQLIVFTYHAVTSDSLTGLSTSFASGWLPCSFIILIFHLVFPAGIRATPETEEQSQIGGLSLYLLLNITEDEEDESDSHATGIWTHESLAVVVVMIPIFLSLVSGITFMASGYMVAEIAMIVFALAAAFLVNYFTKGSHQDHHANLIRSSTWMIIVYWLFLTMSVTYKGDSRVTSILVTSLVVLVYVGLTSACIGLKYYRQIHVYMLRVTYGALVVIILIGLALAFYVHWSIGLLGFVLCVHCVLSFLRPAATNTVGVLITTLAGMFMFVAVLLLAWAATVKPYETPQAQPELAVIPPTSNSTLLSSSSSLPDSAFHSPPVCFYRWNNMNSSDFAHMSLLAYAAEFTVRLRDMEILTPAFDYFGDAMMGNRDPIVHIHRFQLRTTKRSAKSNDEAVNGTTRDREVTVLAFATEGNEYLHIESMTMWIEAIALAPFSLILPRDWTAGIIRSIAFMHKVLPYAWRDSLARAADIVHRLENETSAKYGGEGRELYLTGHSFAGAFASIVGARLDIPVITFGAPGIIFSRNKFEVSEHSIEHALTSIITTNGALSGVDRHSQYTQKIDCPKGLVECQDIRYLVCSLGKLCGNVNPLGSNYRC